MAAFVASFFGGQPLLISGVTGPISVFNKTIYDIIETRPDAPNYLHFIGWVYFWAAIMHWVAALFNGEYSGWSFYGLHIHDQVLQMTAHQELVTDLQL
jgi:hypothetical protein